MPVLLNVCKLWTRLDLYQYGIATTQAFASAIRAREAARWPTGTGRVYLRPARVFAALLLGQFFPVPAVFFYVRSALGAAVVRPVEIAAPSLVSIPLPHKAQAPSFVTLGAPSKCAVNQHQHGCQHYYTHEYQGPRYCQHWHTTSSRQTPAGCAGGWAWDVAGAGFLCDVPFLFLAYSITALMKPMNMGLGLRGRLVSSGWAWVPRKKGWVVCGSSRICMIGCWGCLP